MRVLYTCLASYDIDDSRSRIFADASLILLLKCFSLKLNLFLSGEFGVFGLDSLESAVFLEANSFTSEIAESNVCCSWGDIGRTVAIVCVQVDLLVFIKVVMMINNCNYSTLLDFRFDVF